MFYSSIITYQLLVANSCLRGYILLLHRDLLHSKVPSLFSVFPAHISLNYCVEVCLISKSFRGIHLSTWNISYEVSNRTGKGCVIGNSYKKQSSHWELSEQTFYFQILLIFQVDMIPCTLIRNNHSFLVNFSLKMCWFILVSRNILLINFE